VGALSDWPPAPARPSLAEVPLLIPTVAIDGVDDAVRTEFDREPAGEPEYHQYWFADDGEGYVRIRTHRGGVPFRPEQPTLVDIAPWDEAYVQDFASVPGPVYLTLVEPSGYVEVQADGLGAEQVEAIGRSLVRHADGAPGWEIGDLPDGLVELAGGWVLDGTSRDVDWFADGRRAAEITIAAYRTDQFGTVFPLVAGGATASLTDVNGAQALAVERDAPLTQLVWSPSPEITVYFGVTAPLDQALSIARSIRPVDQSTWESVSRVPARPSDGCSSFLC
jgi:hypothetical protein